MDTESQLYEIGYLIAPSMTEEEAQNFHQTVKNKAQDAGARMDGEGRIEKRILGYPIKKQKEAYLAHFRFSADPARIGEISNTLETQKEVLRTLSIKTVPHQIHHAITTRPFRSAAQTFSDSPPVAPKIPEGTPAVDVKEIDKKLDEILGA